MLAGAAACSGTSSSAKLAPTPSPTFTQLGTFAISRVIHTRPLGGARCPSAAAAFPQAKSGEFVSCDAKHRHVYLLGAPIVRQQAVDATTVGRTGNSGGWSVYLQLTRAGAATLSRAPGTGDVAVVYDGVVLEVIPSIQGGLVDISGLSKVKARRISSALNPS
jgi:preprotein translocase subunit SecD